MKLTLVSVSFHGHQISKFVNTQMINEKAVVPMSVINEMLEEIGCFDHGLTFTIG